MKQMECTGGRGPRLLAELNAGRMTNRLCKSLGKRKSLAYTVSAASGTPSPEAWTSSGASGVGLVWIKLSKAQKQKQLMGLNLNTDTMKRKDLDKIRRHGVSAGRCHRGASAKTAGCTVPHCVAGHPASQN